MSIVKRANMTERTSATALGTDIASLQDTTGANWYKITLTNLYTWVKNVLIAAAHTWTAIQTFSLGIDVNSSKITSLANGTASDDAVNKSQLDTKQNTISSNDTEVIINNGGTLSGDTGFTYDDSDKSLTVTGTAEQKSLTLANGFINTKDFTPSGTADATGQVGDECKDENYFYRKTSAGWKRSLLETW